MSFYAFQIMRIITSLWFLGCMASSASAQDYRQAAPWSDETDTIVNLTLRNFGPWAFSEKFSNGIVTSEPILFKWEGPLEIVFAGVKAPIVEAEVRHWLKKLGRYYPDSISFSPIVTPRTNIVFAFKDGKEGEGIRVALQQALSAKYQSDIPKYPEWDTDAWCQVNHFSRDITWVRPLPLIPSLWVNVTRNAYPIDFIFVTIQADFDKLYPGQLTQRTLDLLRTACVAEETLHALTGWQDIVDERRRSTSLNADDPDAKPGARGLEAEALMESNINEPTPVDLLGLQVLYDGRLRPGMTESETREIVTEILSGKNPENHESP